MKVIFLQYKHTHYMQNPIYICFSFQKKAYKEKFRCLSKDT